MEVISIISEHEYAWYISQGLGVVAAVSSFLAFRCKQDKHMLLLLAGSNVAWGMHFLFLAEYTGCFLNFVTAVRNFSGLFLNNIIVVVLFITLYLTVFFISFASLWDLLPIIAVVISSLAVFYFRGLSLRVTLLIGSLLWLVFNINARSIVGVVVMAADSASNVSRIKKGFN